MSDSDAVEGGTAHVPPIAQGANQGPSRRGCWLRTPRMNRLSQAILGLVLAVAFVPAARTAPPEAQAEINYLLQYVKTSGCEFYRNGSWFDAGRAQAHLRQKYELAKGAGINSAEDFIEQTATKSSLSGQPYKVRCGGGEPITANQWLHAALAALRTGTAAAMGP
ncbi:MAG: hypothetical protein PVSMB6_18450 [Steroidobacteraceae bacterium]